MPRVIDIKSGPDYPGEKQVIRLHKFLQSFQISFTDDQYDIEGPVVLA